jgi:hypothetical protein
MIEYQIEYHIDRVQELLMFLMESLNHHQLLILMNIYGYYYLILMKG